MALRQHSPETYRATVEKHGGSIIKAAIELGVSERAVQYNVARFRSDIRAVAPTPQPVQQDARLNERIKDLEDQLAAVTMVKRWAAAKPSKRATPKPRGTKHLVIPDTQVKVGVPIDHLTAAGHYAAEKKPDVIVIIGDWWDMASLSSYDRGKLSFEGRRYRLDIEAGKAGMEKFLAPIRKVKGYEPRIVFTAGNHEERIQRAIQEDSRLEGLLGYHDLQFEAFGIEFHEFLEPVVIDGVCYAHFFPRAANGAVGQTKNGAPNARAQLIREGRSCVAGHKQGLDLACAPLAGRLQWGVQAGSFYVHDESYLSAQGNDHFRGLVMLHEVRDGALTPMVVSMDYLLAEYL